MPFPKALAGGVYALWVSEHPLWRTRYLKICLRLKSLCLESCSPMGLSFTGSFKITTLHEHELLYVNCGLLYLHTIPDSFGQELKSCPKKLRTEVLDLPPPPTSYGQCPKLWSFCVKSPPLLITLLTFIS